MTYKFFLGRHLSVHDDAIAVECAVVLYFSCSIPLLKGVEHFGGSFHHIRRGDDNERTCRTVPTIMCVYSFLSVLQYCQIPRVFKVKFFLIGNKKFLLLLNGNHILSPIKKEYMLDFKKISLTSLIMSRHQVLSYYMTSTGFYFKISLTPLFKDNRNKMDWQDRIPF